MKNKIVVGSDQKPTPEQLLEIYEKLDTQMKEIKGQMKRGSLNSRHIQALIEHRNPFLKEGGAMTLIPFKYDKTKDGWKLLEDVLFDGKEFVPEFLGFLKPGESSVNGDVMRLRAKELNVHTGQRHAEWLLEHQDRIPKELRGKYLVFPDTVWRDSVGYRGVPYLGWNGDKWCLNWNWLENDWNDNDRLIRLHNSLLSPSLVCGVEFFYFS